jgi:hypothetical protein
MGVAIVDVDEREFAHLLLREVDLQAGGHLRHRVNRDRDSVSAPDVALLEQDLRHTAIIAGDDDPYFVIGRVAADP